MKRASEKSAETMNVDFVQGSLFNPKAGSFPKRPHLYCRTKSQYEKTGQARVAFGAVPLATSRRRAKCNDGQPSCPLPSELEVRGCLDRSDEPSTSAINLSMSRGAMSARHVVE